MVPTSKNTHTLSMYGYKYIERHSIPVQYAKDKVLAVSSNGNITFPVHTLLDNFINHKEEFIQIQYTIQVIAEEEDTLKHYK